MKIETTNGVALEAARAAVRIAGCPMPGVLALKFSRLVRPLHKEATAIEQFREAVLEECVERDSAGQRVRALDEAGAVMPNAFVIAKQHRERFTAEVRSLMAGIVELDVPPLTAADVESIKSVQADWLIQLGPFFIDEGLTNGNGAH